MIIIRIIFIISITIFIISIIIIINIIFIIIIIIIEIIIINKKISIALVIILKKRHPISKLNCRHNLQIFFKLSYRLNFLKSLTNKNMDMGNIFANALFRVCCFFPTWPRLSHRLSLISGSSLPASFGGTMTRQLLN